MSLKSVEQLIDKYGVCAFSKDTPFLKRRRLTSADAYETGLPFCFHSKLEQLKQQQGIWCFTAFLPAKKQRLAMYLVDSSYTVIEQVYFPRDARSVRACEKIKKRLNLSLSAANSDLLDLVA